MYHQYLLSTCYSLRVFQPINGHKGPQEEGDTGRPQAFLRNEVQPVSSAVSEQEAIFPGVADIS